MRNPLSWFVKSIRKLLTRIERRVFYEDLDFDEFDFDDLTEILEAYGDIRPEIARAAKQGFRGSRISIDAVGAEDYLEQWEHLPTLLRALAKCIENDIDHFGEIVDTHIED